MRLYILLPVLMLSAVCAHSQADRWQQRAEYQMEINFNVDDHIYTGKQTIAYYNNSPDTLSKVFYHLYLNAFQPGSMMDVKSLTIEDPDRRVGERISKLSPREIGYQTVSKLTANGKATNFHIEGTILEVSLPKPILPGEKTMLYMEFEAQVPLQIRRTGRDNREGISYSMTQWYPKLCEYDYQGWHSNPYIGREFYGIWGDFDVKIKINRKYTVGGTGQLQNISKMGHGYSDKNTKKKGIFRKKKLEWHFIAKNVHDFAWAADPDYTHFSKKTDMGTELHYFYQENDKTQDNWMNLHKAMNVAEKFMSERYGKYPYPVYAFIQGGDGGMEYPMATLITGERSYPSLVGVSIHEWMHSWYQLVLGTNEALYAWMDEGFTSYASNEVMNHLRAKGIVSGDVVDNPQLSSVRGYARFAKSGKEEPLSIHADHYVSNTAYGVGAYTKGSAFLSQIEYIVGKQALAKSLLRYYDEWKFKHPNPNDFIRVVEKVSGLELDWFKEYWVYTTKIMDYAIVDVKESGEGILIELAREGLFPMPMDVRLVMNDGSTKDYYIPLRMMRGEKANDVFTGELKQDWPWTHQNYSLQAPVSKADLNKVIIDPSERMADVELSNNVWPKENK